MTSVNPTIARGFGADARRGRRTGTQFRAREQMIDQGAKAGANVVLLPECLDLAWTHPSALGEAEPVPGPRSDR